MGCAAVLCCVNMDGGATLSRAFSTGQYSDGFRRHKAGTQCQEGSGLY